MTKIDELPGYKEMTNAIAKARKKGISIEFMMELAEKGTIFFKIGKKPLTKDDSFDIITVMINFHISIQRTQEILIYIKKLMTDYKESIADVLRDIYHNIPGYEKYFAAYILGKNLIYKSIEEQTKLSFAILPELDIKTEKLDAMSKLIEKLSTEEMEIETPRSFPPHTIKKIMESDYEENEKIFITFLHGML